ncbi:galactoside alpha-(1,2)-fucosyltransferase 2-like isoform X2 [Bombina bombina]|uniref:galactoside alpha-(1,2)-fucosyltransferase 2-like isoform X2 n=1 Tax=Bombina bombina TaxID=8345 RepID=UPI00235B2642|nr:galactoside alpha-(1,2)-fucosyltransferase 2-like isoform X2 [Bombina bombina]
MLKCLIKVTVSLSVIVFAMISYIVFVIIKPNTAPFVSDALRTTNKNRTGMWTINPMGRLGNLMGEYATLFALAKLNGHNAYVLPQMHSELSQIFKVSLPVISSQMYYSVLWTEYELHDWMSPEYYKIDEEFVRFTGYPCSWTFYHHIREEIIKEFTFHDYIKEQSNAYLANIRGNRANVTFVGVHVRRGDYIEIMHDLWKGVIGDRHYLQKAMDYFRVKYENPLFVITSNGMDWCKENIDNSKGDVHFAGDGQEDSPGQDFALLVHCNHTIMTIGTFGIWAGYLAGVSTFPLFATPPSGSHQPITDFDTYTLGTLAHV